MNGPRREDQEAVLRKLKGIQREFGYVPEEQIKQTARSLGLTISEVYGIATFYSFLSTKALGKYVIRICQSIPCCLKNAEMIIEAVSREIKIEPGQTTSDCRFSLELTNCIGACDLAPAMLINDEVYGHLTPEKIAELLRGLKDDAGYIS
jgi:NADH:ubiquinone oxidoreductase subunit E